MDTEWRCQAIRHVLMKCEHITRELRWGGGGVGGEGGGPGIVTEEGMGTDARGRRRG